MPTQVKLDKGQGLASGRTVTVDMSGTYLQKDNVLATESLVMRADDLRLQGQLMSRDISLQATQDVVNEGVQVIAGRDLQVTAGRNILSSSVVHGGQITQLAAFAAGNTESGQLVLSAGGDIRTDGALVQNLSKGATKLQAGQDVVLGTVSVTQKTSTAQGRNRRDVVVTQDVGSQVVSQGDIRLEAGRDIVGKAATIQSAEGAVAALAGRDVQFSAGEKVTVTDDVTVSTKRRLFKKMTTTTHTVTSETQAVESSVGGTSVSMQSGQDIHLTGAAVVADQQVQLVAARDVTLDAKQTKTSQTVDVSRKTSGLFKSGPMTVTLGTQRENTHSVAEAVNVAGTRVASLNGDVVIQAGRNFKQEGSHVMAPRGDVQVVAQKIDVVEAARDGVVVQLLEEAGGFIDGDHAAGRADDLRQIHRGVARPAAKIQN
jgi:filamentous hemagglutinin